MNWARERRLQRLIDRATYPEQLEEERRREWRMRAAMGLWVRDALRQLGIEPRSATMLEWAYEAVEELDARGEPTWTLPEPFDWLSDKTLERVERYRRDTADMPDLGEEALGVIFAWCVARLDPDGTGVCPSRAQPARRRRD